MNFKIVFQNDITKPFFSTIINFLSPLSEKNQITLKFSKKKLFLETEYFGGDISKKTVPKYILEIDLEEKVDYENYNIREEGFETYKMELSTFRLMLTNGYQQDLNKISLIKKENLVFFKIEKDEINNISLSHDYPVDISFLGESNINSQINKKNYFRCLFSDFFFKTFKNYQKEKLTLNIYTEKQNLFILENKNNSNFDDFFNDESNEKKLTHFVILKIFDEAKTIEGKIMMDAEELIEEDFNFNFDIDEKFCKNINKLSQNEDYLYMSLNYDLQIVFEIQNDFFYCNVVLPLNLKLEFDD